MKKMLFLVLPAALFCTMIFAQLNDDNVPPRVKVANGTLEGVQCIGHPHV